MSRILTLLLVFVYSSISLYAQSNNLILFTENGEKFQVVLNGILQNTQAETNVKLTDLPAPNYKCRAIFADKKLGQLDFNIYFQESGEELTMAIKQNKKGEYVTRYVSSIPIATAPPTPSTQKIIVYSETPAAETVTTTISHTTTTHSNEARPAGESINFQMGVNMNENGGNISIQADGMDMEDDHITSTTTTTTTRTVSSSSTTSTTTPQNPTTIYLQDYNGPVGCPHPMNPSDFTDMKKTISSKDFESTRLSIAKQVLQNNCLFSDQVSEILTLFDFENTKLEFAKYAYAYTYDLGNYFKVSNAFEFESSVEDLNSYISSAK
ncbi:MAG TPA: DUF4476 domain-containing protein [Bacteroidia bacterium]|nr:DUF4476 domain-containing protein [Bacteroidia bacterium]